MQCGSGPRPAAHSAKRRFLNCLETSLTPSSTASKASLRDRSRRAKTQWQGETTMAVKCGSGPRPAAHSAKRGSLNCLETSLTPSRIASKASLRDRSRQFRKRRLALWAAGRGPIRTSLPWCFGPARPVFERSFTGSAGRCETSF